LTHVKSLPSSKRRHAEKGARRVLCPRNTILTLPEWKKKNYLRGKKKKKTTTDQESLERKTVTCFVQKLIKNTKKRGKEKDNRSQGGRNHTIGGGTDTEES